MTTRWTVDQIVGLAPDASSAKAGQGLASARKWVTLGVNAAAAWGECQGSGSTPYKTEIDLSGPAFKCSCPSHKLPCKHSLGLFMLLAEQPGAFTQNTPPDWVADWLAGRATRAEGKSKKQASGVKTETKASSPDSGAREKRVAAGLGDLEVWLKDGVRGGLAGLQNKPASFWEQQAARLVDAQAPGVARLVREMAATPHSGDDWADKLLAQLGSVYLLLQAFNRVEKLPPSLQSEVRAQVGWNTNKEDVLEQPGVSGAWLALGQRVELEEKLRSQRTWLYSPEHNRFALILDFAFGTSPFETNLAPGMSVNAELAFYPGSFPQRAVIKSRQGDLAPIRALQGVSIDAALKTYHDALAQNPWLERAGMILGDVIPRDERDGWSVRDSENHMLYLTPRFENGWKLLALSGGYPVTLFGEWNGEFFEPYAVWTEKQADSYQQLAVSGQQSED